MVEQDLQGIGRGKQFKKLGHRSTYSEIIVKPAQCVQKA